MRLIVHVTAWDIHRGDHNSPYNCPIARALYRAYHRSALGRKEPRFVVVHNELELRKIPEENGSILAISAKTKDLIYDFIRRFDSVPDRKPVKPFSFVATLP